MNFRGFGTEVIDVVEARIKDVKEVSAGPHRLAWSSARIQKMRTQKKAV